MSAGRLFAAAFGFFVYIFLGPMLLFLGAGTLKWTAGWVYVLMGFIAILGSRLVVLFRSPETLVERARFTEVEDAPAWDRLLVPLVGIVLPALSALVAGLDHRFSWTPEFSAAVQAIGCGLILAGFGVSVWAMIVNPFFSAVVRVQADRDQFVVQSGPYRIVRHPSYAGGLLAVVGAPLLLNSVWLLVAAVLYTAVLSLRTRMEDQLLLQELPGYTEYAARTRFRLIPGVW